MNDSRVIGYVESEKFKGGDFLCQTIDSILDYTIDRLQIVYLQTKKQYR